MRNGDREGNDCINETKVTKQIQDALDYEEYLEMTNPPTEDEYNFYNRFGEGR